MKTPEEIIEQCGSLWRQSEGLAESTLLRIALLRDTYRALHAEKSVYLAEGKKDKVEEFKRYETRLNELRGASKLEGDLLGLLQSSEPVKKRTRVLPDGVLQTFGKEKFDRYDRQWEQVLAAEAAQLGWRFWAMDAYVFISKAEEFHRGLNVRLMPHGIVLFTESISDPADYAAQAAQLASGSITESTWRGRWIILLKPHYQTPNFQVAELPGVSTNPQEPKWKLLFSPKKR